MKHPDSSESTNHGFTVVELLVATCIIAILAGFLFGAIRSLTMETSRADSILTMQNIGRAIAQYVAEHNQNLPGPMPGQQHPGLLKNGRWLSNYLHPYLAPEQVPLPAAEITDGNLLRGFVPKHWAKWYHRKQPATPRIYEIPFSAYRDAAGNAITPFGKTADPVTQPANYQVVLQNLNYSTLVAFRSCHGAPDSQLAPEFGEIQNYTVLLFLDWHVEIIQAPK